jgi:hypothetical protein
MESITLKTPSSGLAGGNECNRLISSVCPGGFIGWASVLGILWKVVELSSAIGSRKTDDVLECM